MTNYVLIASHGPFETQWWQSFTELAIDLAQSNKVTTFLVDNGVAAARDCELSSYVRNLTEREIEVICDSLALSQRGIDAAEMVAGSQIGSLSTFIDCFEQGARVIWY